MRFKKYYKPELEHRLNIFKTAQKMPELTGSEKQVAWAEDIRHKLYIKIKEYVAKFEEDEAALAFLTWVHQQTDAKFWIAHANMSPEEIALEWEVTETDLFPELTGSEKQIAWAKDIRYKLYFEIRKYIAEFEENETTSVFLDWLEKQATAKFWIEHREMRPAEIIMECEKEINDKVILRQAKLK